MSQNITIATSLAPGKEIEVQREAIFSWEKNGFTVISINCEEEVAFLKPYFPTVEFIQIFKDGRNQYGKPYVYVDDILNSLAKRESGICGIVNSDIHFTKKKLYSFLLKEAVGSFVYGCRIDVEELINGRGKVIKEGFDYFFFDKSVIASYPSSALCMGLPCWDYWAVLVPLFSGIPVKKIMTPHAYHIEHNVNWNNETSKSLFYYLLLQHVRPLSAGAASPYYILEFIDRYSKKMTFDESVRNETWQELCPHIKNVITKGEIKGRIIDELLFLRRM